MNQINWISLDSTQYKSHNCAHKWSTSTSPKLKFASPQQRNYQGRGGLKAKQAKVKRKGEQETKPCKLCTNSFLAAEL